MACTRQRLKLSSFEEPNRSTVDARRSGENAGLRGATASSATLLQRVKILGDRDRIIDLDVAASRGEQVFNSVELLILELHDDLLSLAPTVADASNIIVLMSRRSDRWEEK